MLLIKYVLMLIGCGLLAAAAAIIGIDIVTALRASQPVAVRWRRASRLALLAWVPLLPALSILVVPSGTAAVRVSQLSGTLSGTCLLYTSPSPRDTERSRMPSSA